MTFWIFRFLDFYILKLIFFYENLMPWAKIYKLYSNENDEFYIGSTKKLANIRLREHIKDAERSQSKKANWINKCEINICIIDYVEYEAINELYVREHCLEMI